MLTTGTKEAMIPLDTFHGNNLYLVGGVPVKGDEVLAIWRRFGPGYIVRKALVCDHQVRSVRGGKVAICKLQVRYTYSNID